MSFVIRFTSGFVLFKFRAGIEKNMRLKFQSKYDLDNQISNSEKFGSMVSKWQEDKQSIIEKEYGDWNSNYIPDDQTKISIQRESMSVKYKSDIVMAGSYLHASNYVTHNSTKYSATLYPYSVSDDDWEAQKLYDGGRYLIIPDYQSIKRKKTFLTVAYCGVGILTVAKVVGMSL